MDQKLLVAAALAVGAVLGALVYQAAGAGGAPATVTVTAEKPSTVTSTVTKTVTETVTETVTVQASGPTPEHLREELQRECSSCHAVPEGVQPIPPQQRVEVTIEGAKLLMANDKLAVLTLPNGTVIHAARLPKLCSLQPGDTVAIQGLTMMEKPGAAWLLVRALSCEKQR